MGFLLQIVKKSPNIGQRLLHLLLKLFYFSKDKEMLA